MTIEFAAIEIATNQAASTLPSTRKSSVRFWDTWVAYAILGIVLFSAPPVFADKIKVIYPQPESADDRRSRYAVALLKLAMRKSGVEYEIYPASLHMQQNRALQQLTADNEISVVWSEATDAREKDFLPIRIPIDKGLLGWRIFLIDKKNAAQFAQLQTLNQLKSLAAGQQHDWPDVQILAANGLKVDSSMDYPSLFKMLSAGRIDYLPRSILEIWDEEQTHPGMNLVVEKAIALQYPAVEYFFVSRGNSALAKALEKGLRAAVKDGSFDRIFAKYNGKAIKLANFKNRKLFKLKNPILQNEMPYEEKDLRQDKDETTTN